MELKLIAQVILKLFGFPVWRTHCQITPGGFLPTNKFDFPRKHTIISNCVIRNANRKFFNFDSSKMYRY